MMLFQLEELYNVDIIVLVKNTFHPCVCTWNFPTVTLTHPQQLSICLLATNEATC
jgi:hypothetical protein